MDGAAADFAVHVFQICVVNHSVVALAFARAAGVVVADAMPEPAATTEAILEDRRAQSMSSSRNSHGRLYSSILVEYEFAENELRRGLRE